MNFPLARTVRKLKEAISRRLPQRRDDSGLTTLEWLLIVAAVAGLAALGGGAGPERGLPTRQSR